MSLAPVPLKNFFMGFLHLQKLMKPTQLFSILLLLQNKAERLLGEMKELNLPLNALAFNEMMTLYMSVGLFDKIPLVIEELKKNCIPLDLFTYNLWVSAFAAALDFESVKMIIQEMSRDPNCNDGWKTYINLTRIFLSSGCLMASKDAPVQGNIEGCSLVAEVICAFFLLIL